MREYDSKKIVENKVSGAVQSIPNWEEILDKNVYKKSIKNKIFLFINYYIDYDENRQAEIDECLRNNIGNIFIDRIYLIVDKSLDVNESISKNKKIRIIEKERPTFIKIFDLINYKTKKIKNCINIIANADIYFDETIELANMLSDNECYALTRYDLDVNNKPTYRNMIDSQDVWMFKNRIRHIDADFTMGRPGCDNRLAYEIDKAGYKITNPSMSIVSYHLHVTEKRNYDTSRKISEETVSKPYKFLQGIYIESDAYTSIVRKPRSRVDNFKIIYHVGLNIDNQSCLFEALSTLGTCRSFNWREMYNSYGIERTRNEILDFVINNKPELIFMQIQTPDVIDKKLMDLITKVSPDTKIINWTGDVRMPLPKWFIDCAKNDNVYTCFTNEDNVDEMKGQGYNAYYLQIGYEHKIYTRNGSTKPDIPSIVFMANNYGDNRFPNSKLRNEIVDTLKRAYGKKFGIYGTGWDHSYQAINYMKNPTKEAEVYRSCKIAIGLSHYDLRKYSSDRLYRAIGSGAFYLTKYYPEIEDEFDIGYELDVWYDVNDLMNKIEYYLLNNKKREEIAVNGNTKVENFHRWINRIDILKKIIGWE